MPVGDKDTAEAETDVPSNGASPNGEGASPNGGEGAAPGGEAPVNAESIHAAPVSLDPQVDPEIVRLREELAASKRDHEQASVRLRTVSKAYTELQAEMKSFRERMEQRSKQDAELQSYEMVRLFFDPVMNLKRSMAAPGADAQQLVQGLQMVLDQFMDAMKKLGLAEIPGVGATFDPNMHEALGVAPVAEKSQDGKVLVVHTAGYGVKGRVLQAAQVVIGKYEEVGGEA